MRGHENTEHLERIGCGLGLKGRDKLCWLGTLATHAYSRSSYPWNQNDRLKVNLTSLHTSQNYPVNSEITYTFPTITS